MFCFQKEKYGANARNPLPDIILTNNTKIDATKTMK